MTSRILKITALLFFAATLFVACDKEETADSFGEIETQEAFMQMEEAGHLGCNGCFQLVFPVTLVFEDGTTAAVDSRIAIRQAIRAWIAENGRPSERPQFAYPFDVTLRDGTVQTIASDEDLRELVQGCRPNGGPHDRTPCYDLVFPVTLVYPDGTGAEAEDARALRQLLHQWRQENPGSDTRPELGYPIQVTYAANDSLITVNSQEELMALREDCRPGNFGPCFTINYPVSIALPDGTTVEADSPQAARAVFQDWRENNPVSTTGERPGFVFPIEVTLTEDGSVVSVDSPQDLRALWNDCH